MRNNPDSPHFEGILKREEFQHLVDSGIITVTSTTQIVDFLVRTGENSLTPEIFHMESSYSIYDDSKKPVFSREVFSLDSEGKISGVSFPRQETSQEMFYERITLQNPDIISTRIRISFTVHVDDDNIDCIMDVSGEGESNFILQIADCETKASKVVSLPLFAGAELIGVTALEAMYADVFSGQSPAAVSQVVTALPHDETITGLEAPIY